MPLLEMQQTVGVNSCLWPAQLPLGEDQVYSHILKCIKDLGSGQDTESGCSCLMGYLTLEARNAEGMRAVKLLTINKTSHFVQFTTSMSRSHFLTPDAAGFYTWAWRTLVL